MNPCASVATASDSSANELQLPIEGRAAHGLQEVKIF